MTTTGDPDLPIPRNSISIELIKSTRGTIRPVDSVRACLDCSCRNCTILANSDPETTIPGDTITPKAEPIGWNLIPVQPISTILNRLRIEFSISNSNPDPTVPRNRISDPCRTRITSKPACGRRHPVDSISTGPNRSHPCRILSHSDPPCSIVGKTISSRRKQCDS